MHLSQKANSDIFPKREERWWTSEEEMERDMRPEQAEGLGREVKEEEKQEVKKQFVL
jgi:hypothetical protein